MPRIGKQLWALAGCLAAATLAAPAAVTDAASASLPCNASTRVTFDAAGPVAQSTGLPVYEWRPEQDQPKAVIIFLHGLTQEALSAKVLCEELAGENYLVLALDERGHGVWHYGADKRSPEVDYKASEQDLMKLCRTVKTLYPDVPLFCLGESCGSGLAAKVARMDGSIMDGMILGSPGTHARVYFIPWYVRDFFGYLFTFRHPVAVNKYIKKYASNDPRVTEEMVHDPLDRYELGFREVIHTAWHISRTYYDVKHIPKAMPVLVMQGGLDHIVRPRTVKPLVRAISSDKKEYVLFPKYGHVLIGTSYIQPDVKATIKKWLAAQVGPNQLSVEGQLTARSTSQH